MNKDILIKGLIEYGIDADKKVIEKFGIYSSLLKEWNEKMNLTAITDDDGISIRHFLDSLSPYYLIKDKENIKILDIGTGAGFPGVPLKIVKDDMKITLLDSLNKRIIFLGEVIKELNLKETEAIHERAEVLGRDKNFREKYDFVFSRAVASLKVLSEYALPFVKEGGYFVSLKAFEIDEEINDAKQMIGNLGGKIEEIKEVEIPFSDVLRKIVIIKKICKTPREFPRSNKKIKEKK